VDKAFTGTGPTRFGMAGIVGNALGFDHEPSADELSARFGGFSLRNLLDHDGNAPMLVINGADDVHVPQHDTLVFQGRRDTEVHLIADTGHCTVSKLPEVLPLVVRWLERTLANVQPGLTSSHD
jgi:esterase FrsA